MYPTRGVETIPTPTNTSRAAHFVVDTLLPVPYCPKVAGTVPDINGVPHNA